MPLMWHYGLKEIQFIAANCCPGRIWARESSQGNNKAQSRRSGAARSHPAVLYLVKSVSGEWAWLGHLCGTGDWKGLVAAQALLSVLEMYNPVTRRWCSHAVTCFTEIHFHLFIFDLYLYRGADTKAPCPFPPG